MRYTVSMRKLIVANWKENPGNQRAAQKLFGEVARGIGKLRRQSRNRNVEVVLCPPFIYLEEIAAKHRALRTKLQLGAQDVFWEEQGAFTSEVGPKMLKALGAKFVIVGHSERRKYAKETDAMINKKIKLALGDGLRVILCVGEPLSVRKKGISAARAFIKKQLTADLRGIQARNLGARKLVIAYEPIWAIGTGNNDTPEDAIEIARFIKASISCRFLYGGSVNSKNVAQYVQYKEVDGALVGGASLRAGEFISLIGNI